MLQQILNAEGRIAKQSRLIDRSHTSSRALVRQAAFLVFAT